MSCGNAPSIRACSSFCYRRQGGGSSAERMKMANKKGNSWFQTSTLFWLLYDFFWMIQRRMHFNPFRSYVGPRPTLWFSCSRRLSWSLTHSNPIFLLPAYSPGIIYFGRERGWWITCNHPVVLKEKNINRKSITRAICLLKSVLHEEKRRKQENHNVGHILSTASQLSTSQKTLEKLPEDGTVMPKHVGATIHN
jgi:hypothetical protein